MANSVTFPTEFGGDGQTYTDDADPNTGMANGGHRRLFIPSLAGAVDMASFTADKASETHQDRLQTSQDAAKAVGAKTAAQSSASAAETAAQAAQEASQRASSIYPSVAEGISDTISGAYFKVVEGQYMQVYLNDNGSAKPIARLASEESLQRVLNQPDALLTSLLF